MIKERIKNTLNSYAKVIENYFFMTVLQVISTLFGILIYPYVIRILGPVNYGVYVLALSVTSYFNSLVTFGFTFPAMKAIVENNDDSQRKSEIVSAIFTAKLYLALLSIIIMFFLISVVPIMNENRYVFMIVFLQIFSEIFFPTWYFQATQKMRIVTYINLIFRFITIPFIMLFVKLQTDIIVFTLIVTLSVILSGISSTIYLHTKDNIKLKILKFSKIKIYFIDGLPFLAASAIGTIKQESVTLIIASFFGLREIAIYDLANKIIAIPRMLTQSINGALFPKIVENIRKRLISKIITYESILGFTIVVIIIFFSKWIVLFLGGKDMIESYQITIALSLTIPTWLIVGAYNNFIFIPIKKYYYITKNQIFALLSFLIVSIIGVYIYQNIVIIAIAYAFSGLCELTYCSIVICKQNLLKNEG